MLALNGKIMKPFKQCSMCYTKVSNNKNISNLKENEF